MLKTSSYGMISSDIHNICEMRDVPVCKGVGLDLCEIARMEKHVADDRFLCRFFTDNEIAYIRSRGKQAPQTLAGLFAAREALGKALGGGIDFNLKEAEVRHDANGRPSFHLTGELALRAGADRFFLSISHDGGMAAAVCIREGN